ncbi:4Fe-4S ferredoxin, partial [bacterium]
MKGSVLVIGGGVAGIQSSLDLAEGGFKVYLLEKGLSIGGVMAQLDKTFPTNDCSMCILSPKMVEAGRHLNIELITGGELLSVDGEPGNFKVKIKKNARYVDLEKCKGCGDCAEACPVEVLHPYEENLTLRKAIWRPFDQAVPSAFAIDKKGIPPCRARCPIHLNAHGYVMAVKAGEWKRAQEIVRKERDFVFAATAARICTHP